MQGLTRRRWPIALAALIAISLVALAGRGSLRTWTEARLRSQQQRQLNELPETGAARLVAQLAAADGDLALVALSLADPRPEVARAAEQGLTDLLVRWERLAGVDAAPRMAELATCLARIGDDLPPERRRFAHGLAERLLCWPVDRRQIDSARLIADCEAVLRLPLPLRDPIVGTSAPELAMEAVPQATISLSISDDVPHDVAPVTSAGPPALLPTASSEIAVEPRQFLPPRAARITDDSSPTSDSVR